MTEGLNITIISFSLGQHVRDRHACFRGPRKGGARVEDFMCAVDVDVRVLCTTAQHAQRAATAERNGCDAIRSVRQP